MAPHFLFSMDNFCRYFVFLRQTGRKDIHKWPKYAIGGADEVGAR
jgi:hypothetical protein